jgi:hypothetical protein
MIGLGFGVLFTLVAGGQYAFLRHQIDKEATQDLLSGAQMRDDILSAEPWNLEGYRNSTSGPDTYIVVAANGTLIDAHGFQARMLPRASVPFSEKFDQILKYTSDVKENWNLYIHKLTGRLPHPRSFGRGCSGAFGRAFRRDSGEIWPERCYLDGHLRTKGSAGFRLRDY